jgi:hypothetical protein
MLKELLGTLVSAFSFLKSGFTNLTRRDRYQRPSYKSGLLTLEDFAETTRTLTVDGARTINGTVHFVSLIKLREFYGDDWPQVEEHVHSVTCAAIAARLHRGDIYARYHDDGYLLLICNLWREAASTKCRLIARDISKQLFDGGDEGLIQTMEVNDAVQKAFAQNDQDLTSALSSTSKADESTPRNRLDFFDPDALARRASRIDVDGPREGTSLLSGEWERESDQESAPGPEWETDDTYINPRVLADMYRNDVDFSYRPIWQIRNRIISSYVCVPISATPDGDLLLKESEAPSSPKNAAIDFLLLERVSADLEVLLASGRKFVLMAPIHYSTLNVMKNRRLFLEVCGKIPDEQREFIVFEAVGLPPSLPSATITHVFSALQPFGRAILVRRRMEDRNLARLKSLGAYAVGVDLSSYDLPERKLVVQMDEFNARAQKAGLPTYVTGLKSISSTTAAIGAGFSLIGGEPILSLLSEPEGVIPFKITDLYQPIKASA